MVDLDAGEGNGGAGSAAGDITFDRKPLRVIELGTPITRST